ncbi:MAG: hypothetical protein A3E83_00585 [Gammaproteobacteria bacterium RIFCSPHIGHO2_12_FULL_41_20]|nr:MAG: hypothetical protein A3E83_00585 [Gammaproteobacteria bacterium RIFCSPHIGHO2_12_FULL_41_20]
MYSGSLDLSGVSKTLLLPLFGRALLSQKAHMPIYDQHAVELINKLDYSFDEFKEYIDERVSIWWLARAYHFDRAIKGFLRYYPKATIVNLGAGLDTTFYRVDNSKLTWIDLDLPEVMTLRKKLLPPSQRVYHIAQSVFDGRWVEEVRFFGGQLFFIAGGLLSYYPEEQVKKLLLQLAEYFPGAEFIFDSIHTKGIEHANAMLAYVNIPNAKCQWGLDDVNQLINWSSKIQLMSAIPYFKNIKIKYKFPLLLRFQMIKYDFSHKHGIIHIRFARR